MLSQYSWGQFFLCTGAVLVLYYLVVGLLYYRDEFFARLRGWRLASPRLAGVGTDDGSVDDEDDDVGPPPLVRARSAFAAAAPVVATAAVTVAVPVTAVAAAAPEDGAANNLPGAVVAVVGGELPGSTAAATGYDDGDEELAAAAASGGETAADALARDAEREETADQPNEALAALLRDNAQKIPADQPADGEGEGQADNAAVPSADAPTADNDAGTESGPVGLTPTTTAAGDSPVEAPAYEPLADFSLPFNQPVAALADVTPALEEELFGVEAVAAYIAQVQAGERPPVPPAMAGTGLAEQLAHLTSSNTDELTNLFGADDE